MYYLNDGVYMSFLDLILMRMKHPESQVEPVALGDDRGSLYRSTLWGPTCDGLDWIARGIYLPELSLHEYLAFRDMGAYTISMATAFNAMPVPKIEYIVNEAFAEVRDALQGIDII
jgi:diaminopimelate decarboxylase